MYAYNKTGLTVAADSEGIFPYFRGLTPDLLDEAEVISFDFFDTLFSRPLADPEDVFDILAKQLNISDFKEKRQAAQAEAFRTMKRKGLKEISIQGIYAEFADKTCSTERLINAEYSTELRLVEPNLMVFNFFKELIASGKKVIVTSDMYLSAGFFTEVLAKYGVHNVTVFSSSDENATKRDHGELFDIIAEKLCVSPGKIIHLGDNELSDVTRPKERGLKAFHYLSHYRDTICKGLPLALSIAQGMSKSFDGFHNINSYKGLGFVYGGTVSLGFLAWIKEQVSLHSIDHVLFLSRDGYIMQKMVERGDIGNFVKSDYFYGSRTSLTLSTINDQNFMQFIPFLLSGAEGLQPREVLERIGVIPPSDDVMASFGLSAHTILTANLFPLMIDFLYAYRWQILQVCRRNRRGLYSYIRSLGISSGTKIALVDVGWSGTTQEAFYNAINQFMDFELVGYYLCLANTSEKNRRKQFLNMHAMYDSSNSDNALIDSVYANRVAIELFFSAPHDSIIGYQPEPILPIGDRGRGVTDSISQCASDICEGSLLFSGNFIRLRKKIGLELSPYEMTRGIIDLVVNKKWQKLSAITEIANFDAWGSSRLKSLCAKDYLTG